MVLKYDLHVHSNYSDGLKSLRGLCSEAKSKKLGGFAVTDHDTIAGWKEIPELENKYGLIIFPGVELSTTYYGKNIHILGYFMKDTEMVEEHLRIYENARVQRIKDIVAKLNNLGLSISFDEVVENAGHGTVGRPHVASVLLKKRYVHTFYEAFDKYIDTGKPAYVPRKKFDTCDAIRLISEAGGYSVMAHPVLDNAIECLDDIVKAGINGIEAYHPSHSIENINEYVSLAKSNNLFVTAGSDYHGTGGESHGNMGARFLTDIDLPDVFCKYLAEKRPVK